MSDNEYIDLNEFEENTFFHHNFDSLGNDSHEREVKIQRRGLKTASARHRIEKYLEMKNLREQLYDPVFNIETSVKSSGSTYYT